MARGSWFTEQDRGADATEEIASGAEIQFRSHLARGNALSTLVSGESLRRGEIFVGRGRLVVGRSRPKRTDHRVSASLERLVDVIANLGDSGELLSQASVIGMLRAVLPYVFLAFAMWLVARPLR